MPRNNPAVLGLCPRILGVLLFVSALGFACCGPAAAQSGGAHVSGAAGAALYLNGTPVAAAEAAPFLDANHRIQVPLRLVGEALGGQVAWMPEDGRIAVQAGGRLVEMLVGHRVYLVNGRAGLMDTAPVIRDGRAFVPVRFLAEALRCRVDWDGRRVMIWAAQSPAPGPCFYPGAPAAAVLQEWGDPVRRDPGRDRLEWWVYHRDYEDYRLLGIRDGRVAVFYTNSPGRSIAGLTIGEARSEVERIFPTAATVRFHHQGAEFIVEQGEAQMAAAPVLLDGDRIVQLFFDVHRDHRLTAFRIMDIPAFLALTPGSFNIVYRHRGPLPDLEAPPLRGAHLEQVNRAEERLVFDLANAVRQREGLPLFRWDERVAAVARSHSEDMRQNDFFSHVSPATGGPGDRLSRHGIRWRSCAENIALCPDAVTAHEAWLDSPGHRVNLLSETFTYLGVGVADRYYTQNFVR